MRPADGWQAIVLNQLLHHRIIIFINIICFYFLVTDVSSDVNDTTQDKEKSVSKTDVASDDMVSSETSEKTSTGSDIRKVSHTGKLKFLSFFYLYIKSVFIQIAGN